MKLFTPDKQLLMEVTSIREHPEGLLIEGKIMGALPMKAILRPEQVRAARALIGWRLLARLASMVWRGGARK